MGRRPAWEGRKEEGGAGAFTEGRTGEDHGCLEDNELRLEGSKLRDVSVLRERAISAPGTKPALRVPRGTTLYRHRWEETETRRMVFLSLQLNNDNGCVC